MVDSTTSEAASGSKLKSSSHDDEQLKTLVSDLKISDSIQPSSCSPEKVNRPSSTHHEDPMRVRYEYHPDTGVILDMYQLEKSCRFLEVDVTMLKLAQLFSVTEHGEREQMIYDCYADLHMRETGEELPCTDPDRQVMEFGDKLLSNPRNIDDYQVMGNLAISLHNRFVAQGKLSDVNRAIACHYQALSLVPDDFVDKSEMTYYLGRTFFSRFERLQNIEDLDHAIEFYELAVALAPESHPMRKTWFMNLGDASAARFQLEGDIADLDQSIVSYTDLMGHIPETHEYTPMLLKALGTSYTSKYELIRDPSDIDQAINYLRKGLLHYAEDDTARKGWLSALSHAYMYRFQPAGEIADIDSAISYGVQTLSLITEGDEARSAVLSNLGKSHFLRFMRLAVLCDIEQAITYHDLAVALLPENNSEKPSYLYNLGNALIEKYDRLGKIEELERAITSFHHAISLTPEGHTDRPERLDILGNAYELRFEHLDQISDIGKAITCHKEAVLLTPGGHPDRFIPLGNLGTSLSCRFERLGELIDLEESILYQRECLSLIPEEHPDRLGHLGNLGSSLLLRFERLNRLPDLEESIKYHTQALELTPEGHAGRPDQLDNLGNSLIQRFEYLGVLSDIDWAVTLYAEAVARTHGDHKSRPVLLGHLASSLCLRFDRLLRLPDINQAIQYQKEVLLLLPEDHRRVASTLNNLGNALASRFERLKEIEDIDQGIAYQRQAMLLASEGHADRPQQLENLGSLIITRHEHTQDASDAVEGIACLEQALSLTPEDNAIRVRQLNNLGAAYIARYKSFGELSDINQAINFQEQSVLDTPAGHANRPQFLVALGRSLQHRFEKIGELGDVMRSINLFKEAAQSSSGGAVFRFSGAYEWAMLSRSHAPSSTLEAYRQLIDLVPSMVWLGATIHERYEDIPSVGNAVIEAAAVAIEFQAYDLALEWLEEGRSIVWKQTLQLRTPVEDLRRVEPILADRLQQVALDLEQASSVKPVDQARARLILSPEQSAQQHRRLAEEWDELVQKIRLVPGFHSFLKPKRAIELFSAARSGAVVVVNVHWSRCDALVLTPNSDRILHVPLPGFSHKKAFYARAQLQRSLLMKGVRERGVRMEQPQAEDLFANVFSTLWTNVAKPILDCLGYMKPTPTDELPRITWCTTGPLAFLPLHAAGIYREPQSRVFNYAISSYTPTISALLASPRGPGDFQGILAVGQAASLGASPLPGTIEELDRIEKQTTQLRFTRLDGERATDKVVLKAMKEHSWVHLACHAVQNTTDPTASAFLLHDTKLSLATIAKNSLEHANFAFLSACQTATGDENLPEEAVHLAAGMIMAGYSTVIATMWSIQDKDAPVIADRVYAGLLEGGAPDSGRAAKALHKAVEHLRSRVGENAFASWVPYIHIGL